jgi:16S rRNA (uracil1498-N3)-methyltransferase
LDVDLIYTFCDDAGKDLLHIKGELYKYLIKVRRHSEGDEISLRSKDNLKILHTYKVLHVEPRTAQLSLISSQQKEIKASKSLHVGWCVIDTKNIEKTLPSLCEMGVAKITFISCERSQKNFKLDFKRLQRIQESAMSQSGRSSFVELDTCRDIESFIKHNPDTKVFDFCDNELEDGADFDSVLIGCEGGFSQNEREILKKQESFRLKTPMVLRSESAVLAVASKILL